MAASEQSNAESAVERERDGEGADMVERPHSARPYSGSVRARRLDPEIAV
jgi:hypothetical protein